MNFFRSTPNSMDESLNSIDTTNSLGSTNSQTFLSLDIDDFCQSYSKLKLERDPAQDSLTSGRNLTNVSSNNSVGSIQLFESNEEFLEDEEVVHSSNQQFISQSFTNFLAYLTKQDQEQNSIISGQKITDSNSFGSTTMNQFNNQQAISIGHSPNNQPVSFPNNFCNNNTSVVNNSLSNMQTTDTNNTCIQFSSLPANPPTNPLLISNTSLSVGTLSNHVDPKDSKTKLQVSNPIRKNSISSTVSSSSPTSTTSLPLLNTKLTKQSKTRKRKNSSTSPSQLSMQFKFPVWTFHFSKAQPANKQ